jgi:O-antigen ligase
MNALGTYNSALQVAAAFFIFVVGYLALLFVLVVLLLLAEGLHQAFNFALIAFLKSAPGEGEPPLPSDAPAVIDAPAFSGWTHRLTESLTGLKHRYFQSLS